MRIDDFRAVKKSENWSDIYNNLTPHPDTKLVLRKVDVAAINQSIKNLIMINAYERPFSDVGISIRDTLFENFTPQLASNVESRIKNLIENNEPRASLQSVNVQASPDMNKYAITISYIPIYKTEVQQLRVVINRTR